MSSWSDTFGPVSWKLTFLTFEPLSKTSSYVPGVIVVPGALAVPTGVPSGSATLKPPVTQEGDVQLLRVRGRPARDGRQGDHSRERGERECPQARHRVLVPRSFGARQVGRTQRNRISRCQERR